MNETVWQLAPSMLVQDVAQELQRLKAAFDSRLPVVLDVAALTAVDTAGVQLLMALAREGVRLGIPVALRGESLALEQATRLLGLPAGWPAVVPP